MPSSTPVRDVCDRPSPTLDRLIALARLSPDQPVAVAGPAALPAVTGLMRKGFGRAACVCGRCGIEAGGSEALLLTGPLDALALEALVPQVARVLGARGVVAVHEGSLDAEPALMAALARCGLEVDWVVHDLSRTCLAAFGVHRAPSAAARVSADEPVRMEMPPPPHARAA